MTTVLIRTRHDGPREAATRVVAPRVPADQDQPSPRFAAQIAALCKE